jgi:N-methylhydantoinase A/oxoprolinase/acetone carboxylase beta subunit
MNSASLIIGIDTGGTYTDAVVIDSSRHVILSSAKALTTRGDLSVGVIEAMHNAIKKLSGFDAKSVGMVSVSTTLATNAVVEGHGGAVGLVLAGFDDQMVARSGLLKAFPGMPLLRIVGGHDHTGAEVAKPDLAAVNEWLAGAAAGVSAVAVAASFAVRNPAHELAVREVVEAAAGKPVTLSHELASALDAPRRAQTAVLNARLVSRISDLVRAVQAAMQEHGLSCPLMMVKGDGSLARVEAVAQRPIETVLSGPAASLIGAQWLSGLDSFIMSDMGGTTTDVGLLIDGLPQVAEQGAEVGGWRTMVKAIDVKTIGLGGDSEVALGAGGVLELGPQRAVPIALIGQRFPEVIAMLQGEWAETQGGSQFGKFVMLPFGSKGRGNGLGLSAREAEVLAQVGERPVPLRKLNTGSAAQRAIAALRKRGLVQYAAFTPSDAAHVLGLQDNWSAEAGLLAAKLLVRLREMKMPDEALVKAFCTEVWDKTVAATCKVILDSAFGAPQSNALVNAICRGEPLLGHVKVSLRPEFPIVAVGGPVKIYYPEAGKRLGAEMVFAPHCDVANAVGAAAGLVACRAVTQVEGDGAGLFRVTGQGPVLNFASATEALATAQRLAEEGALAQARLQGARDPIVKSQIVKHFLPDASNDDGLLTASVAAVARGRALPD